MAVVWVMAGTEEAVEIETSARSHHNPWPMRIAPARHTSGAANLYRCPGTLHYGRERKSSGIAWVAARAVAAWAVQAELKGAEERGAVAAGVAMVAATGESWCAHRNQCSLCPMGTAVGPGRGPGESRDRRLGMRRCLHGCSHPSTT